MTGDLVMAAVPLIVAGVVLWRGFRPLDVGELAAWQARFDATVPSAATEMVRRRLHGGRRLRSSLIAVGIALGGLPGYMNIVDPSRSADFANPLVSTAWLFGAAIGAVIAEVVVAQRPTRRVAALLARRPEDYVDARFARAVMVAVPVAVILAATSTATRSFDWWESWVGVAATVVAAVGVHVGLRALADRPALDPSGPLNELDDAFRADGAHHLVGAAIALAATGAAVAAPSFDGAAAILPIALQYAAVLGYVWWWKLARNVRWSVRRVRAAA